MSNPYYTHTTYPTPNSPGSSASLRNELENITLGFDLLPTLAANGYKVAMVNSAGTALIASAALQSLAITLSTINSTPIGASSPSTGAFTTVSATTFTGAVVGNASTATALATARTIGGTSFDGTANVTSFPTPGAIGGTTPSTGAFTTLSATGATTLSAALTYGGITLSNAVTGTGNMVLSTSPVLVTPNLGTPSTLVGTNITGTAAGLTAGNVTTNANLTGEVTSVGNAATLTNASVIGKVLTGYVSGAGTVAATDSILQAIQKLNGNAATIPNLTGAITSIGNATSLGSFSSANLLGALTDETGTGSAVFATSPTLVTPILGTPTSATLTNATGLPISTGVSGLGTGIATSLAVAVGSAGAPVVNGGVLGTPSSGTATNLTGLPISTGVSGLGTGVATSLAVAVGSAGAPVVNGGVLGTPSSGTATNLTGLPISTGVSGLGTGVATFLATPSSANLISAVTNETGTGSLVFATSPTLVTPILGTPTSATLTNATGLPLTTGVTGQLPVANGGTGTATPSIVAGTNVTVTGTWPNQTINSTASGTGDVVGPASSTDNAFARFDSTTGKLLQNSTGATLSDTGAAVFTGALDVLGNSTAGSNLKLYEDTDNGTNYVSFKAPDTIAANVTWTLPAADGTSAQVLSTNGTGTLSWATAGGTVTLSNDTSTATNLYPLFAAATSGTASTIYTGNAKLLYKPSTGELASSVINASNGIVVNSQTVSASYTIATGSSGMSSGPVTVASGQSVTISSGSRWVVL